MKFFPIYQKCNVSSIIWIGFLLVFLLAGSIGHDPWKQDETYSFGIIYHFFNSGNWLVPENAGTPFMEKPPLYYWTASLLCSLLQEMMPLHDCARLASVFYMLVAVHFMGRISQKITQYDTDMSRIYVLLFISTLGVVRHMHDMFTDVALLAGTTITLYGMVLLLIANDRWKESGLWLGIGVGMAFLSKGFLVPIVLTISGIFLLIILSVIRTRNTLFSLLFALLIASPFLFLWPALLYQHSGTLFREWFWENNVGRFLGFSVGRLGAANKPFYMLYSALWFAFPVFPLAVIAFLKHRKEWKTPYYLLPVTVTVVGLGLLSASASARALYLLPLIPAITLLAADGLYALPKAFLIYWNKVMRCLFTLAITMLWLIWFSLHIKHALPLVDTVFPAGFTPQGNQWLAIATAFFATVFYFVLPSEENNLQLVSARLWFGGIASAWIVAGTLLLPWTDETKSYRPVITQMYGYIKHSPYNGVCMNEYNLGESIAPMLEYFSEGHTLHTVNNFAQATCPLLLTVTGRSDPVDMQPGWKLVWKGSRVLDAKDEELRLYARE